MAHNMQLRSSLCKRSSCKALLSSQKASRNYSRGYFHEAEKRQRQPNLRYRTRPIATIEPNTLKHSQNVGSRWIYSFQAPLIDPKTSFEGKNVIVTGANTGLGLEAAIKFTALDASKVILGVRDLKRGEHAKSVIEDRTDKKDKVEVWQLDMDSYDSIQDFAKRASNLDHLDVAVLNAGVYMVDYQESKYGWEKTLQVNVISTALLGLLLLPKLKRSKNGASLPVLEFVSSGNHQKVTFSEEQRNAESLIGSYNTASGFAASQQYAASKLFIMYVMQTLASFAKPRTAASRLPEVVVTSVCPGYCKSELSRGHNTLAMNVLRSIANALFLRTTEEGSRSLVSGTTQGQVSHGRFWKDDEVKSLTPLLVGKEGEALRQKVWKDIVATLKRDVPGIDDMISQAKL